MDGEDKDELGTEMGEVSKKTEDVEAADGDGPRDELGSGLHARLSGWRTAPMKDIGEPGSAGVE